MRLDSLKVNSWYYIIINEEKHKPIMLFKFQDFVNPKGAYRRLKREITLELYDEGILIDFKKDQIPLVWENIKDHTYPVSKMGQETKREFFRKMFYDSTKIMY